MPVNDERAYRLLWPDKRTMGYAEIVAWARDEWHNQAPRWQCPECDVVVVACSHGKPVAEVRPGQWAVSDPGVPCHCGLELVPIHEEGDRRPDCTVEAIQLLEDLGLATFDRRDMSWATVQDGPADR